MRFCPIDTARHSSAATGRSTGCASPASTVPSIFGRLVGDDGRPLVDPGGGRDASDSSLPRPHDGVGDHVAHADGHRRRHRRAGHGRRQSRPRARKGCAASSASAGDVHRRRSRVEPGVRPAPRVRARSSDVRRRSRAGWPRSAGADVLVISSPMLLTVDQSSVSGRLQLRRGEQRGLRASPRAAGRRARRASGASPRSPHGWTTR